MLIKSGQIRLASLFAAILLALPLPFGILTGFFIWTSPNIMLNTLISQQAFLWLNLIGLVVLIVIIFKDRFFCRYICPVGALCDPVSKFASKRSIKNNFPNISKSIFVFSIILSIFGIPILIILDPINAFNAFFDPLHSEFSIWILLKPFGLLAIVLINLIFPHAWCRKICPLGGMQFIVSDIKHFFKKTKPSRHFNFSENRRYFISGILGAGAGILTPKILKAKEQKLLLPPGTIDTKELGLICSRCGNCIKSCPTNIIKPNTDSDNWVNILSPHLDFIESYCLPECKQCGDTCPTGAIKKFTLEEKKQLFIGCAELTPELCLLTKSEECDRCKFSCEYNAIRITDSLSYSIPEIINKKCVGCGACQVICPTEAIKIKPIT